MTQGARGSGEGRSVLLLAHRIPYPPDKGDKIRSYNMAKYMREKGWQVHVRALADDPRDLSWVPELSKQFASVSVHRLDRRKKRLRSLAGPLTGRPLSVPFFYEPALQKDFDETLDRHHPDAVLCICSPMAEYVFRSRQLSAVGGQPARPSRPAAQPPSRKASPRLVIDLMDVDSDKWAQYAENSCWPISLVYRVESRLLARYEERVARAFGATLLASPAEADFFRKHTGLANKIHAVGNGVDLDYFHPAPPSFGPGIGNREQGTRLSSLPASQPPSDQPRAARLVFCGAMDYFPNVDAVTWFAREVLPLVRGRLGDVRFTIVGSNPSSSVLELTSLPGVEVTGRVDDVRPHVWAADASVAPIRIARGIQNKVLEAMAMGKPVVATPRAFEGIDARAGEELLVAEEDPEAFTASVVHALTPGIAGLLGERARQAIEERYAWPARLRDLDHVLVSPCGGETT